MTPVCGFESRSEEQRSPAVLPRGRSCRKPPGLHRRRRRGGPAAAPGGPSSGSGLPADPARPRCPPSSPPGRGFLSCAQTHLVFPHACSVLTAAALSGRPDVSARRPSATLALQPRAPVRLVRPRSFPEPAPSPCRSALPRCSRQPSSAFRRGYVSEVGLFRARLGSRVWQRIGLQPGNA